MEIQTSGGYSISSNNDSDNFGTALSKSRRIKKISTLRNNIKSINLPNEEVFSKEELIQIDEIFKKVKYRIHKGIIGSTKIEVEERNNKIDNIIDQ